MANTRSADEPSTIASSQNRFSTQILTETGQLAVDASSARIEVDLAQIEGFDDDGIEALCSIIGAKDVSDVARKLFRFVLANSNPGSMLGRTFDTEDPGGFEAFVSVCPPIASFWPGSSEE